MAVRMTSLLLAVVLVLGVGACSGKSGATGTVGNVPGTPLSPLPTGTDSPAQTPSASPTPILPDGRSAVYLTKIDASNNTITFDLIEFLTGDAAKKAWQKANPGDPDGPPNDYFIVNDNPKLRTLPVGGGVTFHVIDPASPGAEPTKVIDFADANAYFKSVKPDQSDHRLSYDPFWITVSNGVVSKIEEQFLP